MKQYKMDYKVKSNPRKMKRIARNMLESFDGEQDAHYFKPTLEKFTYRKKIRPL
jgi:hypothetical protein